MVLVLMQGTEEGQGTIRVRDLNSCAPIHIAILHGGCASLCAVCSKAQDIESALHRGFGQRERAVPIMNMKPMLSWCSRLTQAN